MRRSQNTVIRRTHLHTKFFLSHVSCDCFFQTLNRFWIWPHKMAGKKTQIVKYFFRLILIYLIGEGVGEFDVFFTSAVFSVFEEL